MSKFREFQTLLGKLSKLLGDLPSKEEKEEIVKGLEELISFLTELKETLNRMPSLEEAEKAKDALENLENILQRNPIVKKIIAGKPVKAKTYLQPKQPKVKLDITEKTLEEEISKLYELSEDEIIAQLSNNKKYTKKFLLAICQKLGRSAPSKATKKQLIELIVTTIINRKTYEGLMHHSED